MTVSGAPHSPARIRLRELSWPSTFPSQPDNARRAGALMAHGCRYQVFDVFGGLRCELTAKIQRRAKPESPSVAAAPLAIVSARDWEAIHAFVDGESVMSTYPSRVSHNDSEHLSEYNGGSEAGCSQQWAGQSLMVTHLKPACRIRRPGEWELLGRRDGDGNQIDNGSSLCRVHMVFELTSRAMRNIFDSAGGIGLVPLPKLVDTWVATGSMESGFEAGK